MILQSCYSMSKSNEPLPLEAKPVLPWSLTDQNTEMGIMAVFSGHWWYAWWPFTNQQYFQWQWGKPLTSAFDYGVKVTRENQHE